jgi:hypothetical protein
MGMSVCFILLFQCFGHGYVKVLCEALVRKNTTQDSGTQAQGIEAAVARQNLSKSSWKAGYAPKSIPMAPSYTSSAILRCV